MRLRCMGREFRGTWDTFRIGISRLGVQEYLHRRHLYLLTQAKAGGSMFPTIWHQAPRLEV